MNTGAPTPTPTPKGSLTANGASIATAALAVSLASLLIASLTLFKGLLETAEGYKKCGKPSIGPWSQLRWRRWRWFQLRFETRFIAPRISIHKRLPDGLPVRGDRLVSLRNIRPAKSNSDPVSWRPTSHLSRKYALSQCERILATTLHIEHVELADLESQTIGTFPSENKVSWLLLLQSLRKLAMVDATPPIMRYTAPKTHNLTGSQSIPSSAQMPVTHRFPSQQSNTEIAPRTSGLSNRNAMSMRETPIANDASMADPSTAPRLLANAESGCRRSSPGSVPTEFVISFLEWTWDIMPKDASRPMAKITLGEIITLGFRLGMRWRVDLAKETFVAHGQGFGLTCTRQGDMDLVATFTKRQWDTDMDDLPSLIPNRATDKLMCGIIPVSSGLLGEDIHCTSDQCPTDVLSAILERLKRSITSDQKGLIDKTFKMKTDESFEALQAADPSQVGQSIASNDAVALMCEFLPMPAASAATLHYFPGWTSSLEGQRFSIFNRPKGWSAFLSQLTGEFCSSDEQIYIQAEAMGITRCTVQLLQSVTYSLSEVSTGIDLAEKAVMNCKSMSENLASTCLDAFNSISDWFREPHIDQQHYASLVSTHCYMCVKLSQACTRWQEESFGFEDQWDEDDSLSMILHLYMKDIDAYVARGEGLFGEYMASKQSDHIGVREQNDHETQEKVFRIRTVLAWRLMTLRGIAWSMSTYGTSMGEPVPSSCFDHPRNVWIV